MVVGEVGEELGIPSSTLSHHLEKLKKRGLGARQARGHVSLVFGKYQVLQDLLGFLYAESRTWNNIDE
jgi:ArsR family transcriptional regulator, arsenate/arsenite/antimonite-responsive transcriptional repressor